MIACSSSARNPIDSTRSVPGADPALERDHLPRPGLDVALHAEQPRHREAPDVGVEDPDDQAAGGQRHGQVDRDRRLADAALARRDGQHPGAWRRSAVSGASSRAFQRARAITAARSSASMAATCTSTERTQSRDCTWPTTSRSIWVRSGQAAMVRATSTTTSPPSTRDVPHHAEVDDGVAELGVDHGPQAVADLLRAVARRRAGRRRRRMRRMRGSRQGILPAWRRFPARPARGCRPAERRR